MTAYALRAEACNFQNPPASLGHPFPPSGDSQMSHFTLELQLNGRRQQQLLISGADFRGKQSRMS